MHFSRTRLAASEMPGANVAFFRDSNKQMERFLWNLRQAVTGPAYSVEVPPGWVSSDIAIQEELGFGISP